MRKEIETKLSKTLSRDDLDTAMNALTNEESNKAKFENSSRELYMELYNSDINQNIPIVKAKTGEIAGRIIREHPSYKDYLEPQQHGKLVLITVNSIFYYFYELKVNHSYR